MDQFPANSHNVTGPKKKEAPPKKEEVEKVVTGTVIQKPRSVGRRFRDIFIGEDFKGVTHYVGTDVVLPAIKNLIVDITEKGIQRLVYGDSPRRRPPELGRPRVSYQTPVDRYSSQRPVMLPDQPPRGGSRGASRRPGYGEIIVATRDEGETVIERLNDILDRYQVASVADLHDLVGLPTQYIDNKWGWTNLQYADVHQSREGWVLDLPEVEAI